MSSEDPQEILDLEIPRCTQREGWTNPFVNICGEKHGRLSVVQYIGVSNVSKNRMWLCQCDCGKFKAVTSRDLRTGQTKSCGCLWRENLGKSAGANKLPAGESAFNQLFYNYKKSSRQRGYAWALTKEQFKELTQQNCYYCGALPLVKFKAQEHTNGDYVGNGVDRVDNSIGYINGNVRPCCSLCNRAKADMSEAEFTGWIRRVYVCLVGRVGVE